MRNSARVQRARDVGSRRIASANATAATTSAPSHSHPVARKNALVAISACVSNGNVCRLCWYTDTTCGTT